MFNVNKDRLNLNKLFGNFESFNLECYKCPLWIAEYGKIYNKECTQLQYMLKVIKSELNVIYWWYIYALSQNLKETMKMMYVKS